MTPQDYDYLKQFLKARSGLVLSGDKQYLIESRLLPVAQHFGLSSISALVARLRDPRGEAQCAEAVVEAMTTNESFFFRDKLPFDAFTETILPALLERRAAQKRIRIWCAAASTGQEPYSLAICLKEFGPRLNGWRVDILATDISAQVLDRARAGRYNQFEVQRGLPIHYLLKYFTKDDEYWTISPALRTMVEWRKFNLLDSFSSLGTFDIVFCRNVLIYFDQAAKSDILQRIAKLMPGDGFLVLGAAETVVGVVDVFTPVNQKRGLYIPRPTAAEPSSSKSLVMVGGGGRGPFL